MLQHRIELGTTEMKGAAIWALKQVGMPDRQCSFLQLTPSIWAELGRAVEILDKGPGTVNALDGRGNQGFHHAAHWRDDAEMEEVGPSRDNPDSRMVLT